MNFLTQPNSFESFSRQAPSLQARSMQLETASKIQEMAKHEGVSTPVDRFTPSLALQTSTTLSRSQAFQIQQQVRAEQQREISKKANSPLAQISKETGPKIAEMAKAANATEIGLTNDKLSALLGVDKTEATKSESGTKSFSAGVKSALDGLLGGDKGAKNGAAKSAKGAAGTGKSASTSASAKSSSGSASSSAGSGSAASGSKGPGGEGK